MVQSTPVVTNRLRTERLPNGKRELLANLNREALGVEIEVPTGFPTDFSSIPSFARFVVRWSKIDVAGVVHDWCYHVGLQDASGKPSQKMADDIWRVVAQTGESKANAFQAWVCWLGLRIGGCWAWKKHRANDDPASTFRRAYLSTLDRGHP